MLAGELLRADLLDGVPVLLAGAGAEQGAGGPAGARVASACSALGALVSTWQLDGAREEDEDEDEALARLLESVEGLVALVVDAASLFARAGGPQREHDALGACVERTWGVTRAVAARAFLPAGRGGRIVYIAPPADSDPFARAARAGLENLTRTLSVEWARHAITLVTIAPADAGSAEQAATLCAYLASGAGAYFSGCVLELGPARAGGAS